MIATDMQHFFTDVPWALPVIAIVGLWSLVWSIIGLWTAARNGHKAWFAVFFFVHTLGILEMLYLSSQRRSK
jgi:hypothetical protein